MSGTPSRGSRSPRPRRVAVAAALAGVVAVGVLSGCGEEPPLMTPDGKLISTSTTRIADVNVVSADRDYAKTCLAPTAPDAGKADVARIVVTDPALLDAVCGLGIGPKVVAVTADKGTIPTYLGPQLGAVPTIGSSPDAAAVTEAKPDVVLTTPQTAAAAKSFDGAKVETIGSGTWQEQFLAVATALGRAQAGQALLDEFATEATKTGKRMDASHNEVSLVRFGADSEMIAGTDSFGGQILSEVGVQRPGPQRSPQQTTLTDTTFKDADGDLILVSFDGDAGMTHGKEVLRSDRWLDLGAPTWKRVLIVNDDIWYKSSGLAAGWLVLNDIKGGLDGNSAQF